MKRNMKFLLLLAIFTSSIMAAYFITGCGDDSTVIEIPPPLTNDTTTIIEDKDMVLGSVQGVVRSGYDNSPLDGATVKWVKNDEEFTTTTDVDGYYLIDDSLSSGYYNLGISATGFANRVVMIYIPTITEIKGDIDDDPVGPYEWMTTTNILMAPTSILGAPVTVTGVVYTALPAPGKDQNDPMSLDDPPDPDYVSLAAGVTVLLQYDVDGLSPHTYDATTDGNGRYTFSGVPFVQDWDWDWDYAEKHEQNGMALNGWTPVRLITLPFGLEGTDSTFEGTQWPVYMVPPPEETNMSPIYAPLVGSGDGAISTDQPVVLSYNFERPGFLVGDNPWLLFSREMDPVTAVITLEMWDQCCWEDVAFDFEWTSENKILTLDPALDLLARDPDPNEAVYYRVSFDGEATSGLQLYNGPWQRNFWTEWGMRFVYTNLDEYGDDDHPFTEFPLDGSITIEFDMDVDLTNANGWVVLYDTWNGREVDATISASGATVTINPGNDLKSYNEYELDFRIYSNLRGDYVNDSEVKDPELTFTTVNTATTPAAPTGFTIDYASDEDDISADSLADWNTLVIDFKWDSVGGAEYYQIFAMDNHLNTDFIVVEDNIEDISFHTWQTGTVNFAADDSSNVSFDLYFDDMGLQTPFSDYTEVTFQVRAVNTAGAGPFSAEITVADKTAPSFTVTQTGDADNAAGSGTSEFYLDITQVEYVDSIHFVFAEAGGDPAFVLTEGEVAWDWDVDMRDGNGVVTVAAGATASVDNLTVQIWDNSGNMGTNTIPLTPWIEFVEPNAATTDFMAPNFLVDWTSVDPNDIYTVLDLYLSLDGGTTWFDTVQDISETPGQYTYTVDDTLFSTNAMVALQDTTAGGGWMWTSDEFVWAGLMLTGPDSAWLADTIFYDEGGVDSTGIPLTFDYAGLDSVSIWYYADVPTKSLAGVWVEDTTFAVTGGTHAITWFPPDEGMDYTCTVRIQHPSLTQPVHYLAWDFPVIHDYLEITAPFGGEEVPGGAPYDVTWDTTLYAPHLTTGMVRFGYVIGIDTTWVVDSTVNDGTYAWSVPANTPADNNAYVLIYDKLGLNQLDKVGPFTISGIVVDSPLTATEWLGGTSHNILWTTTGGVGTIDLYYSHDGFVADSTLIEANTADDGTHTWSVPNEADASVWVRAQTNTHNTYATAGPFIIAGVVLTTPNGGEVLSSGGTASVTWTTVGTMVDSVGIHYSVDGGSWTLIANDVENADTYTWNVPNNPSDSVSVRVGKNDTYNGNDVSDAPFTIAGIIVTYPNGGQTFNLNVPEDITWDEIAITVDVKIEYSLNMTDWFPIPGAENIAAGTNTFNWDLDPTADPNLATSGTCLIKVSEASGVDPMSDASNTSFIIAL